MTNKTIAEPIDETSIIRPIWPAPDHIHAGVTTRIGGYSEQAFEQGNMANHVGDDPGHVEKNRQRLADYEAQRCGKELHWQWLEQSHSDHCVEIHQSQVRPIAADAVITASSMTNCVVLSADCLPILLTNAEGSQVAAIHAGWRGLAKGIISNTASLFRQSLKVKKIPSSPIYAWLGPAIGPNSFEVGDDVKQAFARQDHHSQLNYPLAFTPHGDKKYLADLYQLATLELHHNDIHHVYGGGFCTFRESERFFSYRRSSSTGRMASYIYRRDKP